MTLASITARKMVRSSGMVKNCGLKIPLRATSIMPLEKVTPARMPRPATVRMTARGATREPMEELRKLTASLLTPTKMAKMANRPRMPTPMVRSSMVMFAYLLCAIAKFCSNESGFEAIEIPAFARKLGTFCHKKTGQTPMSVRLGMVQGLRGVQPNRLHWWSIASGFYQWIVRIVLGRWRIDHFDRQVFAPRKRFNRNSSPCSVNSAPCGQSSWQQKQRMQRA